MHCTAASQSSHSRPFQAAHDELDPDGMIESQAAQLLNSFNGTIRAGSEYFNVAMVTF
jgi:hypothetical protein